MTAASVRRRTLLATAGALTVAAAFVFGFLAGRVGRSEPDDVPAPSVVAEAAQRLRESAAADVSEHDLDQAAIRGMLGALGDPYASYYDAGGYAEFQRLLDGRYSGVGLWLGTGPSGSTVDVISVLPDSPASAAGLRVGDQLVAVGGRPVGTRTVGEVVRDMRGAPGTAVAITLRRHGTALTARLRRAELAASDVQTDMVTARVARIRVAAFTRGVGREVRAAMDRLRAKRVSGVVLDLRGNPGGLIHEAVEVASAFLDGGTVVSYRGRGVPAQVFEAVGKGDVATPVVVLVDGVTASAAEVVAGALQDRSRAIVVGSRTYGKGSVQQPLQLSDGSAIEVTVARYFTPAGRSLEAVGITPDVEVAPVASPSVALQRAVEVLSGAVAAVPHG